MNNEASGTVHLLPAYDLLSRQCCIVGIAVTPFHEDERHDIERLLRIMLNFKRRLEQRYAHRA